MTLGCGDDASPQSSAVRWSCWHGGLLRLRRGGCERSAKAARQCPRQWIIRFAIDRRLIQLRCLLSRRLIVPVEIK